MIHHTSFIFLRNKKTEKTELFHIGSEGLHENFSEEELMEYDRTPVPFEKLDFETLKELVDNICEDQNWHNALRPVDILCDVIQSSTDKKTAETILRQFILKIEE